MPDGVFVEDAAIVLSNIAVITRPGAESRREEPESVAEVLGRYRPLRRVTAPATLDGGDVLHVDDALYIGVGQRSNQQAVRQLRDLGARAVEFRHCLHLKTAATLIAPRTVLANPRWVDVDQFDGVDVIFIDPDEPFAANALPLGDTILYSRSFPRTRRLLEWRGFHVQTLELSEMEKAEAGVTCGCIVV